MSKQRDKSFFRGGLLIGLGAGLCVGLLLLISSFTILLHHMFIVGIQWTAPGFLLLMIILPSALVSGGIFVLRRAQRTEA